MLFDCLDRPRVTEYSREEKNISYENMEVG